MCSGLGSRVPNIYTKCLSCFGKTQIWYSPLVSRFEDVGIPGFGVSGLIDDMIIPDDAGWAG